MRHYHGGKLALNTLQKNKVVVFHSQFGNNCDVVAKCGVVGRMVVVGQRSTCFDKCGYIIKEAVFIYWHEFMAAFKDWNT